MTYVVTDECTKCMACVDVCPVDCFYEGKDTLAIDPEECIDCGVCVSECPVDAIIADTEPEALEWLQSNKKFAAIWPNVAKKG